MQEDEQLPNTWGQKKKVSDAERLRGIVHEADRSEGMERVQNERGNSYITMSKHLDEATGGWLDPDLCAKWT